MYLFPTFSIQATHVNTSAGFMGILVLAIGLSAVAWTVLR